VHPPKHRPDLEPLPVDVPRHIRIGILAWLLALVVLLPFTGELRESGHLWWLGTCATGVALGLIGLVYLRGRDGMGH
jgi:hypothetical protein